MSERIDWALWRSFLAVAETGSLSAAARRLGLTQPTVGRHVDQLEAALGVRLFLRSPQGYLPSERATALLPQARAMALTAAALARAAASPEAQGAGVVRIAASHVVGAEVLPEALAPLLAAHPGLGIELALSNDSADLLRHEADLAVRMLRPAQGGLVVQKVATVAIGLFAHRSYLQRTGMPESLADLAAHLLIGPDRDPAARAALAAATGLPERALRLRCDSEAAQLAALRAGLGIAACQTGVAARDPGLVPVLPGQVRFTLDCWLAMHDDLRGVARIRLVRDHLAAALPVLFARSPPGDGAIRCAPSRPAPASR